MSQNCRPPVNRHELFCELAASDLLTANQLLKADAAIPKSVATAGEAAQMLVTAKLITQFQAERLLAGRTDGFVLGQHVIQDQVGKGSVGRVYRATHRAMNRTVAIKVLSADVTRSEQARYAFQREVRAAARLNHPHIVTAYDANEVGDRFYLVMEFVDGPTVETLIRERGPLPWPEACELVRQVAVGLQHAHEQGMVHRDIKPANLLVTKPTHATPGCMVKIADFGIAKLSPAAATRLPRVAGLTGTPDYVAPEQATHPQAVDHRADLYSLGCVFYFLLTGQPPFPGGNTEEKIHRHRFEPPAPIEYTRADVPQPVAEIVMRLLMKDPNQRIATAAGVAARLDGLAAAAVAQDDGEMINFELPAVQPGPYSFASGYLTGMHAAPRSGRHAVYPTAPLVGTAETSPWSELTDEVIGAAPTVDGSIEDTPFTPPLRRRHFRSSPTRLSLLTIFFLCGAVVLTTLLAVSFFLRHAPK